MKFFYIKENEKGKTMKDFYWSVKFSMVILGLWLLTAPYSVSAGQELPKDIKWLTNHEDPVFASDKAEK